MAKVALVTGASSGIGLALTKHLLTKGWNVVLADIASPKANDLPADRTLFIRTDVSSFEEQAELFSRAFKWHGRLDFAALNAGIPDRDDIFATIDPSTPPVKPDMSTIDICLSAVYYGIKLYAHYAAQNPSPGGKIVVTASVAGLYPAPWLPQYTAAKQGVVGLVRALAPRAAPHHITINVVCPAMVPTPLDPHLEILFPKSILTDMSIVMRAFDELTDEGLAHTGQAVEVNPDGLHYRNVVESDAPSMAEMRQHPGMTEWFKIIIEQNVRRSKGGR